jgi:hypothetical protein
MDAARAAPVLDLSAPVRTVAGVDLAASDDPGVLYVLPSPPRVALADGAPDVEVLRFVRGGELAGGYLHLTVELAQPPAALAAVATALGEEQPGGTPPTLAPVPVVDASAELLFFGQQTDADGGLSPLLRRELGRTAAAFEPPHTASFSATLTQDGTQLVEAALRAGGAPVGVVYRLTVEGLWPALRVVAHVDWGQVYDHFSLHAKEGDVLLVRDVQKIAESLVQDRVITVQAVQGLVPEEGEPPPDLGPALDWIQQELVQRFCEPLLPISREPAHASLGTLGEIFGVGSAFAVKRLTQVERAAADVDFQRAAVVTRTLAVQAHLADLLRGAPADEHISDAAEDHPFFRRFGLHVRAAEALDEIFVREALLHFAYGTFRSSVRLTPDKAEDSVETWADDSPDGTWSIRPDVTFADGAPFADDAQVQAPVLTGSSRELTLGLGRLLGLLRLDVEGMADPRVLATAVRLVHRRDGTQLAERSLGLSPASPSQPAWFRDWQTGDRIVVETKHLLVDGRAVDEPPFDADAHVVRLPPPFPGILTVQLVADDDWSGLDRVVVALQKAPDASTGTLVFDHAGQTAAVNLDLPDPTDRTFRYRVSRTLATGEVEEDDWVQTDVPFVSVGHVAANKLVVDVTPVGLELPEAGILLIEVDLSYLDPDHQVRDQKKITIQARADSYRWEVAIADPTRRSYEYRITTHRTSGETSIGPWTTSSDRILLVPVARA